MGVLAGAQGSLLSLLSAECLADFLCLSVAARQAKMDGLITAQMSQRLVRLDEAAHVARHATHARMQCIVGQVTEALQVARRQKGDQSDDAEALKKQEENSNLAAAKHALVAPPANERSSQEGLTNATLAKQDEWGFRGA